MATTAPRYHLAGGVRSAPVLERDARLRISTGNDQRFLSLVFVALLVYAHTLGTTACLLEQPLSVFRDYPEPRIGYLLFGVLVLLGAVHLRAATRACQQADAAALRLALALLIVVAVTPSFGIIHILSSLLLFLLLFGYYAILLRVAKSNWRFVHTAALLVCLLGAALHSYGFWQKCFVVYLVVIGLQCREVAVRRARHRRAHGHRSKLASSLSGGAIVAEGYLPSNRTVIDSVLDSLAR